MLKHQRSVEMEMKRKRKRKKNRRGRMRGYMVWSWYLQRLRLIS